MMNLSLKELEKKIKVSKKDEERFEKILYSWPALVEYVGSLHDEDDALKLLCYVLRTTPTKRVMIERIRQRYGVIHVRRFTREVEDLRREYEDERNRSRELSYKEG